jgi:hypothetical protein
MGAEPRAGLLVARPHPIRGSGVAGSVLGGVKRILIFRNPISSLKTPSKSVLTLKIVKPFPEIF